MGWQARSREAKRIAEGRELPRRTKKERKMRKLDFATLVSLGLLSKAKDKR